MRGWVLGAQVEQHVLSLQLRLERWRRLQRRHLSLVVDDQRPTLRASLGIEPRCGQRDFYRSFGRHRLLSRPFAARQALTHVARQVFEGIGNAELFHRVLGLGILRQRLP